MSAFVPGARKLHHFYRSVPMPCPYLAGKLERKLFTRLSGSDAAELNSALSRAGFRRSHDIVYRPVCGDCAACVPVRIPVQRFHLSRSMRRVSNLNADLIGEELRPVATAEHFRLFRRYQRSRHGDSDMARMSQDEYAAMIEEGSFETGLFEFRRSDRVLMGVMLADRLSDGYSAVYSFFEPEARRRSLGTFLVLDLVRRAAALGLSHVYLGYWIPGSAKMDYKARFHYLEALSEGTWRDLHADPRWDASCAAATTD